MYQVHCMNNIAKVGTDELGPNFKLTDDPEAADAFMVRSANLHDTAFSDKLLAIARAGAGVNNIPLKDCSDRGIVVFNTPGANANAVKELVLCGMLLASRDIIGGIEWVRDNADDPDVGKKAEKAKKAFAGSELSGKTLGVIGLGAIGTMVANTARRLGMHVYGYDPYLSVKAALSLDSHTHTVADLDQLLEVADYVTIHVPANDKTRHMLGADQIAKMKDGVVLLNFARDTLVDETALADALDSGHVARYVTDFANSSTTQMKNTIVTPHLGASTREAENNCAVMAADELADYLENGNIANSVNYAPVDLGPISTPLRLGIFHKNIPSMISRITSLVSSFDANIANMSDKSRGEYVYMLMELDDTLGEDEIAQVAALDDVYRVRPIRPLA
jgi:D-3-phosphoglycerate dehydrogenase